MVSGSAFDFIRFPIPCPECAKENLQPLRQLIADEQCICSFCGTTIDLKTEEWQARLKEAEETFRGIRPPSE